MHPICVLRRRASEIGHAVTRGGAKAVRGAVQPLRGKNVGVLLAAAMVPIALTAGVLGYLQLAPSGAASASPAPRSGPGTADWWGTTVGVASPAGHFIDDAALRQWYETLAFEAPHPEVAITTAPRHSYAHGSSTGACGGATNGADQYIGRESGGDPGAVNSSSGAYGCYQIMPGTWASSCSDLGAQSGSSASTQAQCASRLPPSAWGY